MVLFRCKLPNEKYETIFHSFVVVVMDALFDALQVVGGGYTRLVAGSSRLYMIYILHSLYSLLYLRRYSKLIFESLTEITFPVEILN